MDGVFHLSPLTPPNRSKQPARNLSILPPASLVTPRRLDLAVKHRFFRHLLNGDDQHAERIYRWHVLKRSAHRMALGVPTDGYKLDTDTYVSAAADLFQSMQATGFDDACPIPLDLNGELMGGAHRTACALAIGLGGVTVEHLKDIAWAPPWNLKWFIENGMEFADLKRTQHDFKMLMELK